jgi:hypothetical protein
MSLYFKIYDTLSNCVITPSIPCKHITLASIATLSDENKYQLNADTTILKNECLTINPGIIFTIPTSLNFANNGTLINNGSIINNFSIINRGIITNSGSILNKKIFTNNKTLNNTGIITIYDIESFLYNFGIITNKSSGQIEIKGRLVLSTGSKLINETNATITNKSEIISYFGSFITNSGVITTNNSIINLNGTIFNNNSNGVLNFTNSSITTSKLDFKFDSLSTITNNGTLVYTDNYTSSNIEFNEGVFTNNGTFTLDLGDLIINNIFSNNGSFINKKTLQIKSSGTFNNVGTFSNQNKCTIEGTFSNTGIIQNIGNLEISTGNLKNEEKGTINNIYNSSISKFEILNIFTNKGIFNNNSILLLPNNSSSIFNNYGVFTNTYQLTSGNGIFNNFGTVNNNLVSGTTTQITWSCTTFNNKINATFNNKINATFLISILFNNDSGSIFNNIGSFSNNAPLTNNGMFFNTGSIISSDLLTNTSNGIFRNSNIMSFISNSIFDNSGNFTNTGLNTQLNINNLLMLPQSHKNSGTFNNTMSAQLTIASSIVFFNTGTFYNNGNATLNNLGTFNNNMGIFNNPVLTTSSCGVGIITNNPITGGTTGILCPT